MNTYRYYAFIDLLGYKDLINQDIASGEHKLKEKLTNTFNLLNDVNEADISLKSISDSIFVSLNNDALGFEYFVNVLRKLQISFLNNGLLLRGGVTFDAHFENGKVTYSPALVNAYQLESQRAFFPRILIHEAVIEKLRNEGNLESAVSQKLIVSHAGSYQIHFLTPENWNLCYDLLRSLAKEQIHLIKRDPRIYAKHWYLYDYLRAFKPQGAHRIVKYLPSWEK
ncbi:MAG TPA: hypothetical protein VMV75_10625 [Sulfuricella sp.]|nr:hypothetical protein [Sulfuricella sp.]